MLVKIYNEKSADPARSLSFDAPPKVGDHVELDGALFQVERAWHQPNDQWSEGKLAIAVGTLPNPISDLAVRGRGFAQGSDDRRPSLLHEGSLS